MSDRQKERKETDRYINRERERNMKRKGKTTDTARETGEKDKLERDCDKRKINRERERQSKKREIGKQEKARRR